jgi:hypothetical protein
MAIQSTGIKQQTKLQPTTTSANPFLRPLALAL